MKAQVLTLGLVTLITASCPAQSPSFFQPFPQRPKLLMRAGAADQARTSALQHGWQENWSTESPYSPIHYDLKPAATPKDSKPTMLPPATIHEGAEKAVTPPSTLPSPGK